MNGTWEADYMGGTTQEQQLWATCFANEVTGMRQASGENFLIDWNPNACNIPYSTIYPGNAYVTSLGLTSTTWRAKPRAPRCRSANWQMKVTD